MDSNISIRFYRVDRQDTQQVAFGGCLRQIVDMDPARRRTLVAGTVVDCLTPSSNSNGFFWGDLVRLQGENFPSVINGQRAEKLTLPEGAQLGHHAAFMYHEQSGMLGFQMARNAVSLSRFNLYVSTLVNGPVYNFLPVIKPSELRALASMRPKKFIIKVAEPIDLEAVEDDQRELRNSLIALQGAMNGAYVKIQIGMGNTKGDLNKGLLSRTINWFMEQKDSERGKVQTISLTGKNDDGSNATPLNFLKAHIGVNEVIDFDKMTPEQNLDARAKLLFRAFAKRRTELAGFIRNK